MIFRRLAALAAILCFATTASANWYEYTPNWAIWDSAGNHLSADGWIYKWYCGHWQKYQLTTVYPATVNINSTTTVEYGPGWKKGLIEATRQAEDNQSFRAAYGEYRASLGLQPMPATLSQGYGYGGMYAAQPYGAAVSGLQITRQGFYPGGNTLIATAGYPAQPQAQYSETVAMLNSFNAGLRGIEAMHADAQANLGSLTAKSLEKDRINGLLQNRLAEIQAGSAAFYQSLSPSREQIERWEQRPAYPTPAAPQQPQYEQPPVAPQQGQPEADQHSVMQRSTLGRIVREEVCTKCHNGHNDKTQLDLNWAVVQALPVETLDALADAVAARANPDQSPDKRMPPPTDPASHGDPLSHAAYNALVQDFRLLSARKHQLAAN